MAPKPHPLTSIEVNQWFACKKSYRAVFITKNVDTNQYVCFNYIVN
ncbi:hypothetical protein [Lacrimispora sp.]|nr:hypothetical protein [Lacrimispora sp.]MDR7811204.1 hypothetical protein [Lacrimispora sp.]